jgi:hypothetical protein
MPDEPSMALNVQVTLPTLLPGASSGNSGAGGAKKDDQDW